ncbi:MAG: ATP-dependent zinc metalloprotease FtsH [Metamycoplasmataceae bacterium]
MNEDKKGNAPKKKNLFLIVSIIILIALFGFFLYSVFNTTGTKLSLSEFWNKYELAAASTTDGTYFSSITIIDYQRLMEVVFVEADESGKIISTNTYLVGLTSGESPLTDLQWKIAIANGLGANGVYQGMAVAQQNVFVQFLFQFGPIILLLIVMFFIYRSQMKGSGGGMFNPGKNQAEKIKSNKKFSDIAGNIEVKEEVSELVDYLKNPKKYSNAGARIPKGILLGGPPGTGKTLVAKATAGEANVPFYFISASNFVEMFVGVGAKRVREMFKEARKNSPAIIFIDELDAVGRSRGAGMGGGNDEREQTLNQLLVEMDGITENGGLLVMAATNRPDVLDPALLRPGRFDRIITVGLPDIKEREAILRLHAKGKRMDKSISFRGIAKRTPGYSGAQLENVINEASLLSVRENTGVITIEQIDEAIDRVMSGPAKKNRTISKEELEMVAYHEAGHAVVGLKIPGGNKVQKITIIPRGEAGGYNLMIPEKEKYYSSKSDLEASIKSFMGGRAAEEIIYGKESISNGASDDISKATEIARRMVTEWGMSETLGPIKYEEASGSPFLGRDYGKNKSFSDSVALEIDTEIRGIIESAQKVAYKIIKENMTLLELIKTSLLENETIVSEEIEYIAEHLKLPEKRVKPKKTKAKKMDLDELINEVDTDENHYEEAHHVNEVYDADEKDIDQIEDDENREIEEKKNS